jgi:NADPH-dependent curcumin reductase CurA
MRNLNAIGFIPVLLLQVITKRIKMQGFIVGDYAAELARDFHEEMSQHVLTGAAYICRYRKAICSVSRLQMAV